MDTILTVPNHEWVQIYDKDNKSLISYSYPTIIAKRLEAIVHCTINIKGNNKTKTGLKIRAYCAHTPIDEEDENKKM